MESKDLKQLSLLNRKLMKAIEQSTATIVITDILGNIEYVNPQFTKLTGYSFDEAIGKNPNILKSDKTSKEEYAELWKTILSGNDWHGVFCNRKKNGDFFWESAVISPVLDDNGVVMNYIAVKEDVTKQKKANEELMKMSKMQDILVQLSIRNINLNVQDFENSISMSLEEISEFVEADRALIFKYNWEENRCYCQYEWYKESLFPLIHTLQHVDINDISMWVNEHRNGKIFNIPDIDNFFEDIHHALKLGRVKNLITVPVMIANQCVGFVSFDSIFEKHEYTDNEKSLLQVFSQLYASLLERSELIQSLKNEKDKAMQASDAKSEFLANMSHELRTPLNGIIGFSELLMQTEVTEIQRQYAGIINASSKSLLNVINDILDFSKIEAGRLELDIVRTDMIELIEQAIDIIKHPAGKKNIEIIFGLPEVFPRYAYVDSMRLSQVLINLLSNAVKFTNKGEVELQVTYTNLNNGNGAYKFSVRDTGIGISDTQKLNLFKAFTQADTSTTRQYGGTGLGLCISEKLIRKMGSSIHFESSVNEGSVFSFEIEAPIEFESELFNIKINNISRVLLIDQNLSSRINIQKMLINFGIETVVCETASEAVLIMQMSLPYDLVMIDDNNVGLNALESVALICDKLDITVNKQNFLVLHKSIIDTHFHDECLKMGIYYSLEKPLRYDKVYSYLSEIKSSNTINDLSRAHKVLLNSDTNNQIVENLPISFLVVDDDKFNMILAKAMLSNLLPSAIIVEAVNGAEALEKAKKSRFTVIFMDVQMPEMDGNEATRKIRLYEQGLGIHTTIIGLTAGALLGEKEKCLEAGMDDFLTKPIDSQKLIKSIERVINKGVIV